MHTLLVDSFRVVQYGGGPPPMETETCRTPHPLNFESPPMVTLVPPSPKISGMLRAYLFSLLPIFLIYMRNLTTITLHSIISFKYR